MDGKKHAFTDETNSTDISYYFNGGLYVKLLKNRLGHKKAPVGTYFRPAQVPQSKEPTSYLLKP